jgi:hypothetical protein
LGASGGDWEFRRLEVERLGAESLEDESLEDESLEDEFLEDEFLEDEFLEDESLGAAFSTDTRRRERFLRAGLLLLSLLVSA